MIVFAAIVPHSPLLVPTIGKEHREKMSATLAAYAEIEQALYLSKAETICVITPHAARYPDTFSVNLAAKYIGQLKAFGDFSTTLEAKSDYLLVDRMQRALREDAVPFTLTSNEDIDYGVTVPLLFLTPHLPSWKLIPITPSMAGGRAHFAFGQHLKNVLHSETRRVAIIASADLSQRINEHSPDGPTVEGQKFDAATRAIVEGTGAFDAYLDYDLPELEKAHQCAYRPIATLYGVLDKINVHPRVLAYEAPFGVGYLTARFDIK